MVTLYRGVCNIYETLSILVNHTIGGQIDFDSSVILKDKSEKILITLKDGADKSKGKTLFSDLSPDEYSKYTNNQGGTGGENFPRIVDIKPLRPLIEYTDNSSVAEGFGLLGVFEVVVDKKFIDPCPPIGREKGVFCVSNAEVQSIKFYLSTRYILQGENARLRDTFVAKLASLGITLVKGCYEWSE